MARALVLNTTYEPLSVVTARRAVVLVLNEKAIVMEANEQHWRSARRSVPVPSVVRLRNFVKVPYRRLAPLTRNAVFARDGHRCQYCAAPAESLDHVVPRSRGGQHSWDNVVACCRRCNIRKGDRLLTEAGLSLLRRPEPPRTFGWVYASVGTQPDPRWQPYLLANIA